MAYEKLYKLIGFENRPSRKSPLNADNLNKMENTINKLDDRIVEMSGIEDDLEERLKTVETEVTPIERGGTGAKTAKAAQYNLLNGVNEVTTDVVDSSEFAGMYNAPNSTTGAIYSRTALTLWNYVKTKISSILGLTATNYNGTSAKATADADGNVIADTYATQTEMAKKYDSTTSRTANTVLASPNGSAGAGTFRKLVAADLPTVPASKGGTGKATLVDSANALINSLTTSSSAPSDADYFVSQYAGGGTTTTTFHRRPVSALWTYIQSKISSVLGLTATSYKGNAATATKWATARNINGMSVQGDANRVNYGTCSTAAATAAKTVACTGFALVTGAEITVKFTVTNTAASPTLNVNSTGAKAIYYRESAITAGYLAANRTYTFRYNGTQWDLVGDVNIDTNTDTKVTNTLAATTKAYVTGTTSASTNTGTQVFDTGVYLGTEAGELVANKFTGALNGNAATATKATQDADGNAITTTYATKTEVKPVNNLLATTAGMPLDAVQGKALGDRITALEENNVGNGNEAGNFVYLGSISASNQSSDATYFYNSMVLDIDVTLYRYLMLVVFAPYSTWVYESTIVPAFIDQEANKSINPPGSYYPTTIQCAGLENPKSTSGWYNAKYNINSKTISIEAASGGRFVTLYGIK